MPLVTRHDPRIVPEYSLTGDIISYLRCAQQYRRYNLGNLPPSKPVQLWFGEFIHGVMEESYRQFKDGTLRLPLEGKNWSSFHSSVVELVVRSLISKGLLPYRTQFTLRPDRLSDPPKPSDYGIAAERAFASVNDWGTHLFPIIDFAEVRLKGTRRLGEEYQFRTRHYQVQGVVDVVSAINFEELTEDNLLYSYLREDEGVRETIKEREGEIKEAGGFEVVIDYKGMRRPPIKSAGEIFKDWKHYTWQIQTYAWLRERMPDAKPVVAGVLIFLNELIPSRQDFENLYFEVTESKSQKGSVTHETDILPEEDDKKSIERYPRIKNADPLPELSQKYRLDRSILISPITYSVMEESISAFDKVVGNIEQCVKKEVESGEITKNWEPNPERETCVACDFNRICLDTKYL